MAVEIDPARTTLFSSGAIQKMPSKPVRLEPITTEDDSSSHRWKTEMGLPLISTDMSLLIRFPKLFIAEARAPVKAPVGRRW